MQSWRVLYFSRELLSVISVQQQWMFNIMLEGLHFNSFIRVLLPWTKLWWKYQNVKTNFHQYQNIDFTPCLASSHVKSEHALSISQINVNILAYDFRKLLLNLKPYIETVSHRCSWNKSETNHDQIFKQPGKSYGRTMWHPFHKQYKARMW